MIRAFGCLCGLFAAFLLVVGDSPAQNQTKAKKNQMVAGTIKSVDVEKNVLVIHQKVKNEKVDRELSITEDVEFEVGGKVISGSKGMDAIKDRVGASVKVKCDKDVNVLKVTVK